MRFRQLKLGPMANLQYVLGPDDGDEGGAVDAGFAPKKVVAAAQDLDLTLTHILVTHGHNDHVAQLDTLVDATGADVVAHATSDVDPDIPLEHGDTVDVGGLEVTAYHTPGHRPDHVIYRADPYLFTGDLLFVQECGRTDLPGGDPRAMWRSLFEVLSELPPDLTVCPGHDYGPTPTSTLGEEFETNYTLEERTVDEFVEFMQEP